MQTRARGRKLTPLEKKGILERSLRGELPLDIAKALNVDTLRVSGYVRAMKNRGELPPGSMERRPAGPSPSPFPPQPPSYIRPPASELLIRENARLQVQVETLRDTLEKKDVCIQILLDQLVSRKRKS